jgi:hypothetical protein
MDELMQLYPTSTFATAMTIAASTDSITVDQPFATVKKAFFIKGFGKTSLPQGLEEQKHYFIKTANNLTRIYTTQADAENGTNYYNFSVDDNTGYLFSINSAYISYDPMTCWHPAAAEIENIPCCPPVPEVYTNCPNLGSVVYDGATRNLKNFSSISGGAGATYKLGSLNSETFTVNFAHPFTGEMKTWNVSIQQFFSNYRPDRGLSNPGLILYFVNADAGSYQLFYQASANTFPTTTYTQHWDGGEEAYFYAGTVMTAAGLIPSTLTVTFSGQVVPPPQIKVHMPDAYFENKATPINLGMVDEVLTYDPDTLTYWSDVKTYAGILGRIHFSIPNFYPLTSSGIQFVNSGIVYENQLLGGGSILYPMGSFPNEILNTYSNNEFVFYQTLSYQHIPIYEYFGQSNIFRLFTARDEYEGYQTGLALGTTWFDSRIIRNVNLESPAYSSYGPEFVNRSNQKMVIAFTKWASGKFLKSNALGSGLGENPGNLNHYKQSAYFIQSVHPNAHVTSLGL